MTIAEEKRLEEWQKEEKTITLTKGQWNSLTIYLLMSARYREEEKETWERLASQKDENDNPKYKHAASNAKFWKEMNEVIKLIKNRISGEGCEGEQERP